MAIEASIIIPVKEINDYIRDEIIPALKRQTFKNFELIIIPDRHGGLVRFPSFVRIFPSWPKIGPAFKKDLGVKKAKGEIVVFLDDDAYPEKDWLEKAIPYFKRDEVTAVCGPGATPANDPVLAKVSGWMWSSLLGSGGAGTYRCWPGKKREVDDYPAFNLFVRKKDFESVGGFDSKFWPGEDTKLCHDLVYKLGKKIIYDPKILVYHHRRKIFKPHLKQIGRYGFQRGYFVRILPKTSKRIGYFMPTLFALGLIIGPVFYSIFESEIIINFYLFSLFVYFSLLFGTTIWVFTKSKNLLIALLVMPTIFASHVFYGIMFLKGLFSRLETI